MTSSVRRLVWWTVGVIALVGGGVGVTYAQQIWAGGYGGRTQPRFPTKDTFTGGFNFCRAMFAMDRREKTGWATDYPGADINFSIRLAELTKADVKMQRGTGFGAGEGDMPDPVVVRLTDDELFKCPFILMEDAGTARFDTLERQRLREYLLKGGFLFVSDYHGTLSQQQFDEEIENVLPRKQYPRVDLTPPDHPMWRTLFPVTKIIQMASIMTWRRTGSTIERWNENGAPPDARGIEDAHGNLVVVMIHNSDIPDGWEREGEDPEYFYNFSPDSYAVAIDIMMYAMTH
jgi:hypothetical protein